MSIKSDLVEIYMASCPSTGTIWAIYLYRALVPAVTTWNHGKYVESRIYDQVDYFTLSKEKVDGLWIDRGICWSKDFGKDKIELAKDGQYVIKIGIK
jgi:hypothetical protein